MPFEILVPKDGSEPPDARTARIVQIHQDRPGFPIVHEVFELYSAATLFRDQETIQCVESNGSGGEPDVFWLSLYSSDMGSFAPERLEVFHENTHGLITVLHLPDELTRERILSFPSADGTRIIPFGVIRHPLIQLPPPQTT